MKTDGYKAPYCVHTPPVDLVDLRDGEQLARICCLTGSKVCSGMIQQPKTTNEKYIQNFRFALSAGRLYLSQLT
jgi:hypothetical protein